MKRTSLAALTALLLSGCSALVEVQTEPVDQSVQVTSLGVPVYLELAIDLPTVAQGDIVVIEVSGTLTVANPAAQTSMALEIRVSTQGTATPGVPVLYTSANTPAYFSQASIVLPSKTYAPNSQTPETIQNPALAQAVGNPRLWIIASNLVTNLGLFDSLPLELQLNDIVVRAVVEKSFEGLSGGVPLSGL
jgi:hypothetical protein